MENTSRFPEYKANISVRLVKWFSNTYILNNLNIRYAISWHIYKNCWHQVRRITSWTRDTSLRYDDLGLFWQLLAFRTLIQNNRWPTFRSTLLIQNFVSPLVSNVFYGFWLVTVKILKEAIFYGGRNKGARGYTYLLVPSFDGDMFG